MQTDKAGRGIGTSFAALPAGWPSSPSFTKTRTGADGLIAVGTGAGGHGGTVLIPVRVPCLPGKTQLPAIAAGGIGNGEQVAAALALGAGGVLAGTRLIAAPEARAVQAYKSAVVSLEPGDKPWNPALKLATGCKP